MIVDSCSPWPKYLIHKFFITILVTVPSATIFWASLLYLLFSQIVGEINHTYLIYGGAGFILLLIHLFFLASIYQKYLRKYGFIPKPSNDLIHMMKRGMIGLCFAWVGLVWLCLFGKNPNQF
jgi:hypothetical protein